MGYRVTLKTSGKEFTVNTDETILEAALRQGINLPYGCKNGACGSCKGKVIAGQVQHGDHSESALNRADELAGMSLFCCAQATADLIIDVREVQGGSDLPVRKVPCRVNAITRPTADVAILQLQLPAAERFQYLAGQYIEFLLKDGQRRAYSLATAPEHDGPLEVQIRHLPGGVFTDFVFGHNRPSSSGINSSAIPTQFLQEKAILRFEGPLGSFFLREESTKPILFLAAGTGIAPIKAIIEHMIAKKIQRPINLYWGGRRPADLYLDTLCKNWASSLPEFNYIPVVSDAIPADRWQGRRGFVHRAVMADFPSLKPMQVYACGAPVMVNAARHDFIKECQLPELEFFADSFTSAADLSRSFDETVS